MHINASSHFVWLRHQAASALPNSLEVLVGGESLIKYQIFDLVIILMILYSKRHVENRMHLSLPERSKADKFSTLNNRKNINNILWTGRHKKNISKLDKSVDMIPGSKSRNYTLSKKETPDSIKMPNFDHSRSPSLSGYKREYAKMQSTISPFESLTKMSSRVVIEELFKGKQMTKSTIANTRFPVIGFDKQTARKSLVNLKENPHEGRFKNIDRFPSILSTNKKTDSLVGWEKGRRSNPGRKMGGSKDWLVNQLTKKKNGYLHKFKKNSFL